MSKSHWQWLGLFAVSYVTSLIYHWIAGQPQIEQVSLRGSAAVSKGVVDSDMRAEPLVESEFKSAELLSDESHAARSIAEQQVSVAPLAEADKPDTAGIRYATELSAQVTNAPTPEDRGKAIVKLRSTTKTNESVSVLTDVLHSDTTLRNRLFAVTALRSLASQGDEDGAIRAALNQAKADENEKVAAAAQNAYDYVRSLAGASMAEAR